MENNELLKTAVELVITIVAFLLGRYILPKYKTTIHNAAAEFQVLLNYAESFVAYARQFLDASGEEKMNTVVEKLKVICVQQKINVDDETLRAIAQKAYDAMMAGQNSSTVIIESAIEDLKKAAIEATLEQTLDAVLNNNAEQINTDNVSIDEDWEIK